MSGPTTTPWRWETKITEDLWLQELEKKGAIASPLFNGVPDRIQHARACYAYIKERPPHSAEVHIAIAGKEHSYGTNVNSVLHRMDTRSFTNARSIQTPGVKGTIVRDPERKSNYAKYENALESIKDSIGRVDKAGYAYDGLWTIADIVSKWAPGTDGNDPEGYAWFIYNTTLGIRSRMTVIVHGGESPLVAWIPADSRHFTLGRTVEWPDWLIQHHTDGFDSLAWLTMSINSNVSSSYLANNNGSLRAQLVRHRDTPHTTGIFNARSLSLEWERYWSKVALRQFPNGVPDDVYRRLSETWFHILLTERARGNPNFVGVLKREQMKDHNDLYSTVCPANLDVGRIYNEIVALQTEQASPALPPGARRFDETGKVVYGGFRTLWEEIEALDRHLVYRVLGSPTSNEGLALLGGEQRRIQFFNKGVLIWNQALSHPYDVTFMNRDDWERIEAFDESPLAA